MNIVWRHFCGSCAVRLNRDGTNLINWAWRWRLTSNHCQTERRTMNRPKPKTKQKPSEAETTVDVDFEEAHGSGREIVQAKGISPESKTMVVQIHESELNTRLMMAE